MNKKRILTVLFVILIVFMITSCTASDARFTRESPAGFWAGLWHGAISVITFIIGLFNDSVKVYALNNTGSWYDLGFLLGIICIWGGGSAGACKKKSKIKKETDIEWEEIGDKVEKKVMSKLKNWAEADDDDDWSEIEKKVEKKLKKKIREWADKD